MTRRLINETDWWWVKWPDPRGYDVVKFVKTGEGDGPASWGFRRQENEEPKSLLSMGIKADAESFPVGKPVHVTLSIHQLVEETRNFSLPKNQGDPPFISFYRGQARSEWDLQPTVFRKKSYDERSMMNDFRSQAPVRYRNCPPHDDLCGWLTLARHYGLPTRLLDWTLSPLVAAYFAVAQNGSDDEHPGIIWVLNAGKMNHIWLGKPGFPVFKISNGMISELVKPAFDDECSSPDKVIATFPTVTDWRQFAQQSAFTVHGGSTTIGQWVEALRPGIEAEVVSPLLCALIPAPYKAKLREDLDRLGIHEASLFPDLEHLAVLVARDPRNHKKSSL